MIVYLAMIFTVFEVLSMIFNQFFIDVNILGFHFPFNVSVIFFCACFFILDIIADLYDTCMSDKIIYGKIICQLVFIAFGEIGVLGARLHESQLDMIISTTPLMIINGMVASFFGYKITTSIMRYLKVKYDGKFVFLRYLTSTFPGEVVFSLIFTLLSFSNRDDVFMVFVTLLLVKLVMSVFFSSMAVPLIAVLKVASGKKIEIKEYTPFT